MYIRCQRLYIVQSIRIYLQNYIPFFLLLLLILTFLTFFFHIYHCRIYDFRPLNTINVKMKDKIRLFTRVTCDMKKNPHSIIYKIRPYILHFYTYKFNPFIIQFSRDEMSRECGLYESCKRSHLFYDMRDLTENIRNTNIFAQGL